MIPYSYNMVDMGGIDLAEANGTVVPGVYEKIVEAMNLCGDVILYNWKFAGINVAPSAYTILQQVDSILINGLIQVTELDQITVIGLPPPPVPVAPLSVTENGTYEAVAPQSGFNPVTVDVPTPAPVISSISISENGTYTAPEGVDGYSPITVDVPQGGPSNPTTWQTGACFGFDSLHVGGGSSMQLIKSADYSVSVLWNGGAFIGAAIYWNLLFDVSTIDYISVKFSASAHYDQNRAVRLGIANSIAGDDASQSYVVYDSSNDITGDEVVLSVDLTSYTGNRYIVIRADGVSCRLYDFAIHYS